MGSGGRKYVPPLRNLIRMHRQRAGLTQHELAASSGLSISAIRDLEQGRRSRPWPQSIAALSRALDLGPTEAQELGESARHEPRLADPAAHTEPAVPLRIDVLGQLAVWIWGELVPVGSHAQQAVLGLLAINHGRPVGQETIFELLRGEHEQPVRNGSTIVQSRISQLRRTLRIGDYEDGVERSLAFVVGGYQLRIGPAELDLSVFRELTSQAEAAGKEDDSATACLLYGKAFAFCHGEPCANVSMLTEHPALIRVRRELTDALLQYVDVAGDIGRYDLVVQHLEAFAAGDPLNERVHAGLMIALAGSGEQAQAIRVYEELRKRLKRDLAIDPSPGLKAAHVSVLRQDFPSMHLPQPHVAVNVVHQVPWQLPPPPRWLLGREDELASLTDALNQHVSAHSPRVVALTGMGGIGKTALAVYWGHQVADRFPDGQLYINLRGFGPSGNPASPPEIVRRFLTALGVPDAGIPSAFDAQLAIFQNLLMTRKVLVMLDNARNAEQVRPVLSGVSRCFVVVTSRNQMTGLAASHGAHLMPLDCLSEDQSRVLLARGLGEARVAGAKQAVMDIVSSCAGLPLALCSTIAQAAARPHAALAELASAMRNEYGRLDALETRDETTSMRAVFSWSQAKLSAEQERMFRRLSVHPCSDITVAAAASLAAVPARGAYLTLAELADEYLVTEHQPGRYTCHELLRAYAAEILQNRESDQERRAAVQRLLDHYLQSVALAWYYLVPARRPPLVPPSLSGVVPAMFRSAAEATAWLHAERHSLLTLVQVAADGEFVPHTWELPWAAAPFLNEEVAWRVMARALNRALAVARKVGDVDGQLVVHQHLGELQRRYGARADADHHLLEVLALAHRLSDACSAMLSRLRASGDPSMAMAEAEQALKLYQDAGDLEDQLRFLRTAWWQLVHGAGQNGNASEIFQLR
jgi:DNA-binding SARP family transcriptional activator/tetratricopeptide (TPR) repeat protein/DNA-binding XRE family transcriptional regulator